MLIIYICSKPIFTVLIQSLQTPFTLYPIQTVCKTGDNGPFRLESILLCCMPYKNEINLEKKERKKFRKKSTKL